MMLSPEERDRIFQWAAHQLWWQSLTSTGSWTRQTIQSNATSDLLIVRGGEGYVVTKTWQDLITRDDREFLRSIRVKADA